MYIVKGCKNVQNWKKGVFLVILINLERTWWANWEKHMKKRIFRVYFHTWKYVFRVCFVSPFTKDDIQPEIQVPPGTKKCSLANQRCVHLLLRLRSSCWLCVWSAKGLWEGLYMYTVFLVMVILLYNMSDLSSSSIKVMVVNNIIIIRNCSHAECRYTRIAGIDPPSVDQPSQVHLMEVITLSWPTDWPPLGPLWKWQHLKPL